MPYVHFSKLAFAVNSHSSAMLAIALEALGYAPVFSPIFVGGDHWCDDTTTLDVFILLEELGDS